MKRKDPNTSAPYDVPLSALDEYLAKVADRCQVNPWPILVTTALAIAAGLLVIAVLHHTAAVRALEAM